jgi:hypothetical protein
VIASLPSKKDAIWRARCAPKLMPVVDKVRRRRLLRAPAKNAAVLSAASRAYLISAERGARVDERAAFFLRASSAAHRTSSVP